MNKILLKREPVLKIVGLFMAGLIFAYYIKLPINITFIATTAFSIITISVLYVTKSKTTSCGYLIALTIFLTGMLRYQITSEILPQNHISNFTDINKKMFIKGTVVSFPVSKEDIISCEIAAEMIYVNDSITVSTHGKILVKIKRFDIVLRKGDSILISGKLKKPAGERNPGEFNYEKFLKSQGIYGTIYIGRFSNIKLLPPNNKGWSVDKAVSRSREYLEHIICKGFHDQYGELLKGLILGERGEITPEIKNAFSKIGVMHVLAVSGLHVGFIVVIFSTLFKLLRIPFRASTYLTMFCTLFYMLIVGFKPPVVRATIIIELYLWGLIIEREANLLNLLSTAALIILLINPLQLFQTSFQLSFIAVLSIIYFYKILNSRFSKIAFYKKITKSKIGNYIVQAFLVSFAVSCGTSPITIYYFEKLPIVALFINILVVPLVGAIIALAFVYISLASVLWPVAKFITSIDIFLLKALIGIVIKTVKIPFAYVPIYGLNLGHIFLIYLCLLLLFNINKRRCQKAVIYLILIGLNINIWQSAMQSKKWLEVIFIDIGNGDSALLKFPNNKCVLIDGGICADKFDAGKRHVVPYLRRMGIRKLEAVNPSHSDADHLGGIPYVLRNIKVDRAIDNGVEAKSAVFSDYQFLIDSLQITHETLKAGNRISGFENIGLFVFHPIDSDKIKDPNNTSLVIKIIYGGISFLFTGDIERVVEEKLLKFGDLLKCDVLKVPHHGSNSSSTIEFLKMVNPKYAVISVGKFNKFKHPSPKVLQRLNSLDIETIRTDNNGAIIFRTDGKVLERVR